MPFHEKLTNQTNAASENNKSYADETQFTAYKISQFANSLTTEPICQLFCVDWQHRLSIFLIITVNGKLSLLTFGTVPQVKKLRKIAQLEPTLKI